METTIFRSLSSGYIFSGVQWDAFLEILLKLISIHVESGTWQSEAAKDSISGAMKMSIYELLNVGSIGAEEKHLLVCM